LTAILGLVLALSLWHFVEGIHEFLAPVAIGMFIYIAGSDLIPEMHKETKRQQSLGQLFFFMVGIGIMALLLVWHGH
jgi:zinc and cadmium transporter